ncbi:MAG: class II histone deacetylase [Rhodobacter sp.]|nr:class II histone deacetylase [Rhodobacter sp.]
MTRTAFFWDERCFWHAGGNYAFTLPIGGLVQPLAAGGLPENPETKRRMKNLMDVTGLMADLDTQSAPPASWDDLRRVHPQPFLQNFKAISDAGGGEVGLRTPFAAGGFELAALSAGLSIAALRAVLTGAARNAYALSRPPGHHCLPDWPNGFCLLANLGIAIHAARADGLAGRVAVIDWDVHHGNGTEAIFIDDPETLTISLHQEHNYPLDTGDADVVGEGAASGCNINLPLPPGAGHATYIEAMSRIVVPALQRFRPDVIVIACGYDAAAIDPLSRMLATADTFRQMTRIVMDAADDLCGGRLMMAHEGGYSEVYVPFCGHAVLEQMSGSARTAPDPFEETFAARQPNARIQAVYDQMVGELAAFHL